MGGTGPHATWVRAVSVDGRPALPWRSAEGHLIDDPRNHRREEALAEEPP
jgi:hypothetical protein